MSEPLRIDDRHTLLATELSWRAVRSSGPGGQNVNKVSSKVELCFDFERSASIDVLTKIKLRSLGKRHIDSAGALVISSQLTRDQHRNLEDARQKLAELVRAALVRPKRRLATKPTRSSNERRLLDKRHSADRKRGRRGFDE